MRLQTTPTCHNHGDEDTMLNKWREHLYAWLELLHMGPASCTVSKTPPGTPTPEPKEEHPETGTTAAGPKIKTVQQATQHA
jgi:hypothetical protein